MGEYGTSVSAEWYAYRLGLIDASGQVVDQHRMDAVDWFIDTVVDLTPQPVTGAEPAAANFQRVRMNPKDLQAGKASDEEHMWRWYPPYRNLDYVTRQSALSRRRLLGHWWRGALTTALEAEVGPDAATPYAVNDIAYAPWSWNVNRLFTKGSLGPQSLGLLLGPDRKRMDVPDGALLRLPKRDQWWWMARSFDGCRCVVVDVDCKRDDAHFQARMRALTADGMPQPHLIVTTKSQRRHLWYLMEEQAGYWPRNPLRMQVPGAMEVSGPFAERLGELGFLVRDGVLEVFPKDDSALSKFPAVPFGDRSWLCGPDGMTIEVRNPIDAIVAVYDRWHSRHLRRWTLDDLRQARLTRLSREDRTRIAKAPPGSDQADRLDPDADVPGPAPSTRHRGIRAQVRQRVRQKASDHHVGGNAVADGRNHFQRGAEPDHTYEDMPLLAQYIKHHHPRPSPRVDDDAPDAHDEAALRRWLAPVLAGKSTGYVRGQLKRLAWLFPRAVPLSSFDGTVTLTDNDLAFVIRAILTRPKLPSDRRFRSGLIGVFAYVIGVARSNNLQRSGWVETPVPSMTLAVAWREGYKRYLEELTSMGRIELVERASRHSKLVSVYAVEIPSPGDDVRQLAGAHELADLLEEWVDERLLRELFPKHKDATWKSAFKKKLK